MWDTAMHASHTDIASLTEDIRAATERAMARELHDGVIQPLSALIVNLEAARFQSHVPDSVETHLENWSQLAREAMSSLRSALAGLHAHPHAQLGLPEALRQYVAPQMQSQGLDVRLEINGWPDDLPLHLTTSLYLALREALTNVVRHAHASQVRVVLRGSRRSLYMLVADNGVGISSASSRSLRKPLAGHGIGIEGIRDRIRALGGRVRMTSAPGEGTRLELRIPNQAEMQAGQRTPGGKPAARGDIVAQRSLVSAMKAHDTRDSSASSASADGSADGPRQMRRRERARRNESTDRVDAKE